MLNVVSLSIFDDLFCFSCVSNYLMALHPRKFQDYPFLSGHSQKDHQHIRPHSQHRLMPKSFYLDENCPQHCHQNHRDHREVCWNGVYSDVYDEHLELEYWTLSHAFE